MNEATIKRTSGDSYMVYTEDDEIYCDAVYINGGQLELPMSKTHCTLQYNDTEIRLVTDEKWVRFLL